MVTRQQVIDEARTWVGSPTHHQGRLKGVGVDCVGLVVGVCKALGLSDFDIGGYTLRPGPEFVTACNRQLHLIARDKLGPGDVIMLAWHRTPIHLAFINENGGVIHANSIVGKVVEHRMDERFSSQIVNCYHIPGVEQ